MTFLTFGGKCGCFAVAADSVRSPISEARAMPPTPMLHRLKKWRRVRNCKSWSSGFIRLLPCHEVVQVEQHASHGNPGRHFGNLLRIDHRFVLRRIPRRGVEDLRLRNKEAGRGCVSTKFVALYSEEACEA